MYVMIIVLRTKPQCGTMEAVASRDGLKILSHRPQRRSNFRQDCCCLCIYLWKVASIVLPDLLLTKSSTGLILCFSVLFG